MRRWVAGGCFALAASAIAAAQPPLQPRAPSMPLPRGQVVQIAPAPSWAQSMEAIDEGVVVLAEPRQGGRRRGTVALGTKLAFVRRVPGDGCSVGTWVELGADMFVCEEYVRPSADPPVGIAQPVVRPGGLLPHRYGFVRDDATSAYAHPSDYFSDSYTESYGEGFGLIVTDRSFFEGLGFLRTRRGLWIAEDAVRYARGSDFRGVVLGATPTPPAAPPVPAGASVRTGWVLRSAIVRVAPRGGRVLRRLGRRDVVTVIAEENGVLTLAGGGFVAARDIAVPSVAAPLANLGVDERWIDVDVASQTLIAYEGTTPVFTTLVSSGRDRPTHRTPLGEFRIWVKLATADMDDLERQDVEHNYAIEGVPWVQYFEGSNGFHAAFWHDDFGRRKSHGCVNLSPRDARWLFDWTRPLLQPGWTAVLPTPADPGTRVRVR